MHKVLLFDKSVISINLLYISNFIIRSLVRCTLTFSFSWVCI